MFTPLPPNDGGAEEKLIRLGGHMQQVLHVPYFFAWKPAALCYFLFPAIRKTRSPPVYGEKPA
jgi:hypothetical protein